MSVRASVALVGLGLTVPGQARGARHRYLASLRAVPSKQPPG